MTAPIHEPPISPVPAAPEKTPDEPPDHDPQRLPSVPPVRIDPEPGPPPVIARAHAGHVYLEHGVAS